MLAEWDKSGNAPTISIEHLKEGKLRYFSHLYLNSHFPPKWYVEPFTGKEIPAGRHWSNFGDFDFGDIKLYWEPSRFGFVYDLVRAYGAHGR